MIILKSTLALFFVTFAVDDNYIIRMLSKPISYIISKLEHLLDTRHIMVINHHSLNSVMEVYNIICSFTAQVVDLVFIFVLAVQKCSNFLYWISIK